MYDFLGEKRMKFRLAVILCMVSSLQGSIGACENSWDIAVLLDRSTSMEEHGFETIKDYTIGMISKMNVGSDKARICVLSFSLNTTLVFDLKTYTSQEELQDTVSRIPYQQGATDIVRALNFAEATLSDETRGARVNVPKFFIVFSDGDFEPFSPYPNMDKINILAIGTAELPSYNSQALMKLVKDPNKDFFTTEDQSETVVNRIGELAKRSCTRLNLDKPYTTG
ncbi:integrin alpha-1-like isoform X1 [Montipora foliosa]|uniref:integrin alpha-1-like isoform X1 n=2 Tax=Montipora foliosa TaxID=591990 RepID=UPI0035F1BEAE